jgi:phasin family protein
MDKMTDGMSDGLQEFNRRATESAMNIGQFTFQQGERMLQLQLEAVRALLDDGLKAAQGLGEVRDPQQWSALQERNLRGLFARIAEYSRAMQELAGKTQLEFNGALECQLQSMNARIDAMVDEMAKTAPPGSEAAFTAMKQSLSASRAMAETVNRTACQLAQSAQSAMMAAAATARPGSRGGG